MTLRHDLASRAGGEGPGPPKLAVDAGRPRFRARRRQQMLRTAAEVLYEQGLRQATMEEIARALGTSKIAVYRYFPNKDALIAAVLEDVADSFVANEYLPWTGLKHAMRLSLATARTNPAAFLLMCKSAAHDPELFAHFDRVREVVEEATRRRLRLLAHPVGADPVMLDVMSRGLTDFLFGALAHWVEKGDPSRDEAWVRQVAAAAVRLVGWEGRGPVALPPVLLHGERG